MGTEVEPQGYRRNPDELPELENVSNGYLSCYTHPPSKARDFHCRSHVRTLKCGGILKNMLCSRQTPVPKVSPEERLYFEEPNKRCRLQSTCTEHVVGLNPTIMAPRRYCSHDRESASIEEGAQVGSFHLQAQAQARRPEAALYMAPANLLNILPVCGSSSRLCDISKDRDVGWRVQNADRGIWFVVEALATRAKDSKQAQTRQGGTRR